VLTRRTVIAIALVCLATAMASLPVMGPAPLLAAAPGPTGGGECDEAVNPDCRVEGSRPGGGGNGGGSGGGTGCPWNGVQVPCTDPDFGVYIGGGCYWERLNPVPVGATPPDGKDPGKGAWGTRSCYLAPGAQHVQQITYWLEDPQDGPTPAELAQQALAKIRLLGARIGVTPDPGGSGVVGLPVWLWTAVTPGTWGPLSASASGGGITVTITARAQRIVWAMGDRDSGRHPKICHNPGTPYQPRYGNSMSPTCGYRYTVPSVTAANPNGRYTVTATTHWRVDWSGGGQSGVLTPTSQSQTSVRIGENLVVGQ
jgi:hypothetical protein